MNNGILDILDLLEMDDLRYLWHSYGRFKVGSVTMELHEILDYFKTECVTVKLLLPYPTNKPLTRKQDVIFREKNCNYKSVFLL